MDTFKQELISKIKELKKRNDDISFDLTDLASTEGSRADIMSTIYMRKNRELRLKNLWYIENDFRTQARIFSQSPEKYAVSQESIKKSYIEQINRFMKEYNNRYMSIQSEIYRAEENQKILIFKSCKYSNSKRVLALSDTYRKFLSQKEKMIEQYEKTNDFRIYEKIESLKDPCIQFDEKIYDCKKQIKLYENIILKCDKELEVCTKEREKDFKELFEEEQAIIVKPTGYKALINSIMNKLDGEKRFSKLVVKKHANKVNELKMKKMGEYTDRIKQETVDFLEEIEKIINSYGE